MNTPPSWADRFLAWFCDPYLLEDLQGDLHEIYEANCRDKGTRRANWIFVWLVLRSVRPSAFRKISGLKIQFMVLHNLKIAIRVLRQDKLNAALKLLSLTVGITCFILIGMYVQKELRFDHFHSKKERIYRVWLKEVYAEDKIFFNSITPVRFEALLEEHFEEIETAVQFNTRNYLVGPSNDPTDETIAIVSPELFQVFDFEVLQGDPERPIEDENAMILSQQYATKYFGNEDPIGRFLPVVMGGETKEFKISGIFQDLPQTSSIQMDMAISNENLVAIYGERALRAWFSVGPETYVLLEDQASISTVEDKMQDVVMGYLEGEVERDVYNIGFQPLVDIHLNEEIPPGIATVGDRASVQILGVICILVVLLASINYTTLSIGQSMKRTREVGIRKVMGAFRGSLMNQYLTESVLLATLATAFAYAVAHLSAPVFNNLTGANVHLTLHTEMLVLLVGIAATIGILSGLYPAFILAHLGVVSILKGNNPKSKNRFRWAMLMFQFIVTVFLVSSALLMQQQIDYMRGKDLGFTYNTTVAIPLYPEPGANSLSEFVSSGMKKGELLREKLSLYPSISSIGMGSHVFGTQGWGDLAFTDDDDNFRRFRLLVANPEYFETFDIQMDRGRSFEKGSDADARRGIVINEAAALYFELGDAIGKQLPSREFGDHEIIGVTRDFNFETLRSDVEPLIITQNLEIIYSGISDHSYGDSPAPKIVFQYSGTDLLGLYDLLEKEWESTFPEEDMQVQFIEDDMARLYANEARLNKLVQITTLISLIIASLGLLGLTIVVVNGKVKEIGIRKVNGASQGSIFGMLVRGFSVPLSLAVVVSIPLAYVFMNNWLDDFAYRISIGAGVFVFSGILVVAIAIIVMSYHTLRASLVSPVDSLRVE